MYKKIIISVLTVFISFSLLKVDTFADSDNSIYSWLYGTYKIEYVKDIQSNVADAAITYITSGGVTIPYFKCESYNTFTYTMNDYRDGVVTFYYTPVNRLGYADLFVTGATIASWNNSTGQLVLNINGTQEFSVTFATSNTYSALLNGPLSSSYGTGTTTDVNAPATSLHYIDMAIDDTNSTLSEILSAVDSLEANTDGIESKLDDIRSYTNYLTTIDSALASQNTLIANTNTLLSDANTILNNCYAELQIINSSINQTTVSNYQNAIYRIITGGDDSLINYDVFGNYVISEASSTYSMYLRTNYDVVFVYGSNVTGFNMTFSNSAVTATLLRSFRYAGNYTYYVYSISTTTNGTYQFTFNNNDTRRRIYPIYYGWGEYMPQDIMFIVGDRYSDAYTKKMDSIIDALQNMEVNVNSMTVNATGITYNTTEQNVTNSITNYNTNINTVNNIENNFVTTFEDNNNFNIENIPITDQMISTSNFMNDIVTQLYGLDIIKYPLTLMMLGIIIIAILG